MEGQAHLNNNNGNPPGVLADDRISAITQLPPPPGRPRHENMYIVQFPKDQVYRVPPRENALIVERYRNPPNVNKSKKHDRGCCCCTCPRVFLTILLILIAIIAIVGITLATLFSIFNPSGPTFTITNFMVKNPPGPKNTVPKYQISLRAKNPNERLGIVYENSEVTMIFELAKVATGKFPRLVQNRNATTLFDVDLIGTNGALPKKMANSMVDEKLSNTPLYFGLEMRLGVRIEASGLHSLVMNSNVVCKLQVSSLGNNTRILSQQCDTNFKQY